METMKIFSKIDPDGHLKIDVPTPLPQGDVEVVLIIEQKKTNINKYDFSDLSGKLKWKGDPLKEQKEIRNEW